MQVIKISTIAVGAAAVVWANRASIGSLKTEFKLRMGSLEKKTDGMEKKLDRLHNYVTNGLEGEGLSRKFVPRNECAAMKNQERDR